MSTSLVAVFIPILLMGGIVGRLFREFAVTLCVAIAVSLRGVADHDADDVRALPEVGGRASTGASTALASAAFDALAALYDRSLALGAAPSSADARRHRR